MDMLTLKRANKYTDKKVAESEAGASAAEINKVDMDKNLSVALLLNAFRQHLWEEGMICEYGSKTLTNTQKFPFNDSQESVALVNRQDNIKYAVIPEFGSVSGNAGEIVVSDKQVNGFKLAYTGSASSAVVNYIVIGGIIE